MLQWSFLTWFVLPATNLHYLISISEVTQTGARLQIECFELLCLDLPVIEFCYHLCCGCDYDFYLPIVSVCKLSADVAEACNIF